MNAPAQEVQVSAQDLIDALSEQRNRAMNDTAMAVARSVAFQKENEALKLRLAELEKDKKD